MNTKQKQSEKNPYKITDIGSGLNCKRQQTTTEKGVNQKDKKLNIPAVSKLHNKESKNPLNTKIQQMAKRYKYNRNK